MNKAELETRINNMISDAGRSKQEIEALEEVKSIIFDYERQAACIRQMITKYERPDHALRKGDGLYLCPSCNRRVQPRHSHCSWCGKMLRERRKA